MSEFWKKMLDESLEKQSKAETAEQMARLQHEAQVPVMLEAVQANLRRALTAEAERDAARAELAEVIAVAHKHGWDGVTNSKILSTFLDRRLGETGGGEHPCDGCEGTGERGPGTCPFCQGRGTSKAPQTPRVGRIVHYTNLGDRDGKYPPAVIAALITKVNDDGSVALKAFYPTGLFDMPSVQRTAAVAGSDEARGCWAWPAEETAR